MPHVPTLQVLHSTTAVQPVGHARLYPSHTTAVQPVEHVGPYDVYFGHGNADRVGPSGGGARRTGGGGGSGEGVRFDVAEEDEAEWGWGGAGGKGKGLRAQLRAMGLAEEDAYPVRRGRGGGDTDGSPTRSTGTAGRVGGCR